MHLDYLRPGNFIDMLHTEMKNYLKELGEKKLPYKTQAEIIGVFEVILGLQKMKTNNKINPIYLCSEGKTSWLVKGKTEIPISSIEILQSKNPEELISQMTTNFSKVFESDTYFSKDKFCSKMLQELAKPQNNLCNYYENPKNISFEFNQQILEEHYKDGNYNHFMAYLFYYLITRVRNLVEISQTVKEQLKLVDDLGNISKQHIISGAYYDEFNRNIKLIPKPELSYFEVTSTTIFKSKYLSPERLEQTNWSKKYTFSNQKLRDRHQIISLKINEVDYTESITKEFSTEERDYLPYVVTYTLPRTFSDDSYLIEICVKSHRKINYFQLTHRLDVPCFHFRCSVEIIGELAEKFNLGFQMFSPYHRLDKKNTLSKKIYSTHASVTIPQLLPTNSGYSFTARPKREFIADFLTKEELLKALEKSI